MNKFLKSMNRVLAPINLKVSRLNPHMLSGIDLFTDIRLLINSKSPVCLDVGANIGQTIDNLQQYLDQPKIYSFEPSTDMFKILKDRIFDGQVHLFNYGLGAKNEEHEFINYEATVLSSFLPLDDSDENRFRKYKEKNREIVQIMTLDLFLSQQSIKKVDLLKIDTQGFDLNVLKGAVESIKAGVIDYVLIEINFVRMYEGQSAAYDIFCFLEENSLYLVDMYEKVRQKNTLAWCTALFGKR